MANIPYDEAMHIEIQRSHFFVSFGRDDEFHALHVPVTRATLRRREELLQQYPEMKIRKEQGHDAEKYQAHIALGIGTVELLRPDNGLGF